MCEYVYVLTSYNIKYFTYDLLLERLTFKYTILFKINNKIYLHFLKNYSDDHRLKASEVLFNFTTYCDIVHSCSYGINQ